MVFDHITLLATLPSEGFPQKWAEHMSTQVVADAFLVMNFKMSRPDGCWLLTLSCKHALILWSSPLQPPLKLCSRTQLHFLTEYTRALRDFSTGSAQHSEIEQHFTARLSIELHHNEHAFYRTQASLGSNLCVRVSLTNWLERFCRLKWCDSGWWIYKHNTNW